MTVNAKNVIPNGQNSSNFDVKVWLVPRGNQIDRPSDYDIEKAEYPDPDRGMVYQGFRTDGSGMGYEGKTEALKFTLPIGTSLSMHNIYIERIAKKNVDKVDEFISLPVASDPIQAWQIGTEDVILTTYNSINIFRGVIEKANNIPNAPDLKKTKLIKKIKDYQLGKNSP